MRLWKFEDCLIFPISYGSPSSPNSIMLPLFIISQILISVVWDHPRIRGKDTELDPVAYGDLGSPPHTRERHRLDLVEAEFQGITPAYAGKTLNLFIGN